MRDKTDQMEFVLITLHKGVIATPSCGSSPLVQIATKKLKQFSWK